MKQSFCLQGLESWSLYLLSTVLKVSTNIPEGPLRQVPVDWIADNVWCSGNM